MTARERASKVVQEFHALRTWGYDPMQHAEWEHRIAIAVAEAEAAAFDAARELVCGEGGRAMTARMRALETFQKCEHSDEICCACATYAIAEAEAAARAEERFDLLVRLYNEDDPAYAAVAELCDLELDGSGALLGRIRERAAAIREGKPQ